MKIQLPQPFFFEEGEQAVLLLHGFTGNSSDVRQLGRYLQKQGITSYAPHYEGHAEPPENLLRSSPHVWWSEVLQAYDFLVERGYEKIFVAGLSLGGVFAVRLATVRDVVGIATICSPMYLKDRETMYEGVLEYARGFKKMEGKTKEEIEREMTKFEPTGMLDEVRDMIARAKDSLPDVFVPLFVAQSEQDQMINPDSANIIFEEASTEDEEKQLKWYPESGHVLTIDKEKQQLFEDIHAFMDQLDWDA
ncbi:alpha/beta fold hydrolase [Salinicoccus sp. ID82-1]|uniref:Alpha/beta fold hydrolase n=1 Tax=Salinicoccus cyprini TaxID=2493691 RepID=A0A558ARB1_9STAP|nr:MULTISPECIES: alpha/beta fold hydrolase [Salinicoccus]MCG1010143.1 alpha/beta fold hydrolase [Salinicoccus sp. ID82-1]TVT26804.1 alpha/beta fold hydrolase [Salinicoccus cyprini]